MKACWLNKSNNKKLIVFFAGWSFDEKPFKHLECKDFDVLFVYDYNDFEVPQEFSQFGQYEQKYLLAWSMGVFAACRLKDMFETFDVKIAINGTVTPVDNEFGIPIRSFELTLKHAQIGLRGKFYQNIFNSETELEKYLETPVERTLENRVSELARLYELVKTETSLDGQFYDCAVVSEFDKIIPPSNQVNSHKKFGVSVKNLQFGHSPFYNFKGWDEIITICR